MNQYITIVDDEGSFHRSKIIIHNGMWYFAEFKSIEQLNMFSEKLGFKYEFVKEYDNPYGYGMIRFFNIDHEIDNDNMNFYKVEDLPKDSKPIKALSNGSIVDCYFFNDGKTIHFYRPNPNAKDIYKPMILPEHFAHCDKYGVY